jgi:membrane fusion protein, multidrug efflux system
MMNNPISIRQISVALAVIVLAGCDGAAKAPAIAAPAVPVRIASPISLAALSTAHAVGRLEAADESMLSFRTGGVVDTVRAEIGDHVHRGQVLATLESVDIAATVTRAQQQRDQAARDVERWTALADRQLVARKTADDARTALRSAEAELSAARFAQRHTSIVTAADGVVLERRAEPGETVAGGQPVLRVSGDGGDWILPLEVADRDAVRIVVGADAQVRVDAFPASLLSAKVLRIGGQANRSSGAVSVELAVVDSGLALKSGLVAKADIALSQDAGLAVPVEALVRAEGSAGTVMVVRNGVARRLSVTLGKVEGEYVAVTSGLPANAQVIVQGAAYVDDGQAVSVNR